MNDEARPARRLSDRKKYTEDELQATLAQRERVREESEFLAALREGIDSLTQRFDDLASQVSDHVNPKKDVKHFLNGDASYIHALAVNAQEGGGIVVRMTPRTVFLALTALIGFFATAAGLGYTILRITGRVP